MPLKNLAMGLLQSSERWPYPTYNYVKNIQQVKPLFTLEWRFVACKGVLLLRKSPKVRRR